MITLVVLYHSHFVRNCFLSFLQCEWVIKSPRQNSSKTYLSEIFPFPLISDSVSTLTILESGLSPYFTANRAVSFYLDKSEYRISSSSVGEQILEEKSEINLANKQIFITNQTYNAFFYIAYCILCTRSWTNNFLQFHFFYFICKRTQDLRNWCTSNNNCTI